MFCNEWFWWKCDELVGFVWVFCSLSIFSIVVRPSELSVWTPNNRLPTNWSSSHSKTIEFRWILLHFNGKQATDDTNKRMQQQQHNTNCVRLTYTTSSSVLFYLICCCCFFLLCVCVCRIEYIILRFDIFLSFFNSIFPYVYIIEFVRCRKELYRIFVVCVSVSLVCRCTI